MTSKDIAEFNAKCSGDWRLYDGCSWGYIIMNQNGKTEEMHENDWDSPAELWRAVKAICGYKEHRESVV